MIWITDHTHEHVEARLAAIRGQVRSTTRCMALVAAGAAALQMLLDVACIFCL